MLIDLIAIYVWEEPYVVFAGSLRLVSSICILL